MSFDTSTFLAALAGTTIPGLIVSLILLALNHRSAKLLASEKAEIATQLARVEHQLEEQRAQFSIWHERRVVALIEIYDAFRKYLDFLRRQLYVPGNRESLDPMWDFREVLDKNMVFLNDELQQRVQALNFELLQFWNWAVAQPREGGICDDEVQQKLDYEIPLVLERLRKEINAYTDPRYGEHTEV